MKKERQSKRLTTVSRIKQRKDIRAGGYKQQLEERVEGIERGRTPK